MIFYLKDPKDAPKKILDIINTINIVNKVTGYKINLQKSLVFLFTNNELIEKAFRKTIPFIIASKNT
jgi:hypothetical protein